MASEIFHFIMIKPTHYDDDGYPIQWLRSAIPSNSLASVNGLALDCRDRKILGDDIDMRFATIDETNTRVRPERIAQQIRREGGRALIGLIGVQSNQFPHAVDLARAFKREGLQVAIGGFHVSGCLSMLDEMPSEMQEAQEEGFTFFAGELEETRLDQVFRDAWNGSLKPVYNFMDDLPTISGTPIPFLKNEHVSKTLDGRSSFDLGRGCPFQCSFCTIINVQGRKSRFRTADDLELIIRENYKNKIKRFFITDDNFARNKDWEPLLDRLIKLREEEGLGIKFVIQVDTLCHKLPNFIEKCVRAGVNRVFIGLENINPDNLLAAKKRQNKITEYRKMIQEWHRHGVMTYAGYILGFPADTKESILRDIEIIKRELPLDLLEFFFLTPLPGSEDHKTLLSKGVWMDPDLNKYDLHHRVTHHSKMSDEEWESAYWDAWDTYYTPEHIATVVRRAASLKHGRAKSKFRLMYWFYIMLKYERVHPLEGGFFRMKHRRDRRPGLPTESRLTFYPRFALETASKFGGQLGLLLKLLPTFLSIMRSKDRFAYSDLAIAPADDDDLEELSMFQETVGASAAIKRQKRNEANIEAARASAA
ncbi:MAG: radical SAM protein [Pseudomonadota bacterium]